MKINKCFDTLESDLERFYNCRISRDVSLQRLSRWRIGGRLALLVDPLDEAAAASVIDFLQVRGIPRLTVGATTNLLFSDAGLDAVCVRLSNPRAAFSARGEIAYASALLPVPVLARKLMRARLGGWEFFGVIPGTVGGLVVMNAGTQRRSISEKIVRVRILDRDGRDVFRAPSREDFDYRWSLFQQAGETVLGVELSLDQLSKPHSSRRLFRKIMRERRQKFPRNPATCGSVFKSSPEMHSRVGPPGKVIENLGLAGARVGRARVSRKHANFFENMGGATAGDMLELIGRVHAAVLQETGFSMATEVRFVRSDGKIESITPASTERS